jgi:hypothetical protein
MSQWDTVCPAWDTVCPGQECPDYGGATCRSNEGMKKPPGVPAAGNFGGAGCYIFGRICLARVRAACSMASARLGALPGAAMALAMVWKSARHCAETRER